LNGASAGCFEIARPAMRDGQISKTTRSYHNVAAPLREQIGLLEVCNRFRKIPAPQMNEAEDELNI
jgi:hypothetical protein